MDLGLKGKVALVTGAGSQIGFGKAIALTLAAEGCDVIAADMDLKGAEKTVAEIKALGRKAIALKVDITSRADVNSMVRAALEKFGKIDILVNNAGAISQPRPFAEKPEDEIEFDINVNLIGPLNVTKAVINHMISRKSGKIVNTSSSAGLNPRPGITSYSTAKAGVVAFTRALALEVASLGINVNSVAPGMARTNLQGGIPPEVTEPEEKETPLGRLTVPQDIANAVVVLASDVSHDIVGETILVSGGHP